MRKESFNKLLPIYFNSINSFEASLMCRVYAALCIFPVYYMFSLLQIPVRSIFHTADTIIFFKHTPDRVTSTPLIARIRSNNFSKTQNVITDSSPPSPLMSLTYLRAPDMQSYVYVFCCYVHLSMIVLSSLDCVLIDLHITHMLSFIQSSMIIQPYLHLEGFLH